MKPAWAFALIILLASLTGCMTTRSLNERLEQIREEHHVTVRADNPLSRCYLFGYLPGLLDRIDADLDKCPQYFKDNIGPVFIEETFADNPETYPVSLLLAGYVDLRDEADNFPIHIKNRSILERLLLESPRPNELFLHEASHSFEANVRAHDRPYWEDFKRHFDDAQSIRHGGMPALLAYAFIPLLGSVRPPGMASYRGWINHWEDVAETNCYLRKHDNDVDFLKRRDETLYNKCQIVRDFTSGKEMPKEPFADRVEESESVSEGMED